jgi:pimeloyl-ACP methyl ester carboxylesterase
MPIVELAGRGTVAYQWSGSGPGVIVLINGSVFNYHQWDMQALPILQRELDGRFRFLQYDYVGVGGSSAKTTPFDMIDLADELRDLLDALSVERIHLFGISKGSMVGQAFLISHRERALSFCGLGNPNVLSDRLEPTFSIFQERLTALEEIQDLWPERINRANYAEVVNRVYVPAIFGKEYRDLTLPERLRALIMRRMIYRSLEGTYIQTMVDLFRFYLDGVTEGAGAYAAGLPQMRDVPMLLLNGTADMTTPVHMSRELAQLLPQAELVEFEGVTHMGPMSLRKQAKPVFERYCTFMRGQL